MEQAQTVEVAQPAQSQREIEIQFSRWFEKMQAHCSSHHTAGTLETSVSSPEAGVLGQLETEGAQR